MKVYPKMVINHLNYINPEQTWLVFQNPDFEKHSIATRSMLLYHFLNEVLPTAYCIYSMQNNENMIHSQVTSFSIRR